MTPERLAEIRQAYASWDSAGPMDGAENIADMVPELLTYVDALAAQNTELRDSVIQVTSIVDELTRQRDDARRIAIDAGAFQ